MPQSAEIRFDGWVLRRESGELLKDGATIRLPEQPQQILEELLARPGQVVTREQLIARLWPKGIVDFDTSLNTAVRKLRIALRDDAEKPRYIETIPRRGYRFVGRLDPVVDPGASPRDEAGAAPPPFTAVEPATATHRPAALSLAYGAVGIVLLALAVALAVRFSPPSPDTAVRASIAVLPFVDLSVLQQEQALCDGLTEELSNWLAQLPSLRVVARTSAYAFKDKNTDVREIGRALSATHLLEGSVRRSGDAARISVQLIDARAGYNVWSQSFDLPVADILQVQETISRTVAQALQLRFSEGTSERLAARRTGNAEAFELYTLARHHWRKRTPEDNVRAMELYEKAVAVDPDFALAYVGLAEARLNERYLVRRPIDQVVAAAEPLLERALLLNPTLPDAIAAQGWLRMEQFRLEEAAALLIKALALNPSDAASHNRLGGVFERLARPREALEQYDRAAELDPLDFVQHVYRCLTRVDVGRLDEAAEACRRVRELEPGSDWGPHTATVLAMNEGDLEQALQWNDGALALAPDTQPLIDQKVDLLLMQGALDEARQTHLATDRGDFHSQLRGARVRLAAGEPVVLPPVTVPQTVSHAMDLARLYHLAGDPQSARRVLDHAESLADFNRAELLDPRAVRYDYSAALIWGAVDIAAGNVEAGMQLVEELSELLDKLERNGSACYGLHSLRAQVRALQGRGDEAVRSLERAVELGWRAALLARTEPSLASLRDRADFQRLLAKAK